MPSFPYCADLTQVSTEASSQPQKRNGGVKPPVSLSGEWFSRTVLPRSKATTRFVVKYPTPPGRNWAPLAGRSRLAPAIIHFDAVTLIMAVELGIVDGAFDKTTPQPTLCQRCAECDVAD